jgi:hypothetical protein
MIQKLSKSLEIVLILHDQFSCLLIEDFKSDVLLISNLIEHLRKSPHKEPYLIPHLYRCNHVHVEFLFAVSLERCADLQLDFLPFLMILLEDDVASEPWFEEEAEIDHPLAE